VHKKKKSRVWQSTKEGKQVCKKTRVTAKNIPYDQGPAALDPKKGRQIIPMRREKDMRAGPKKQMKRGRASQLRKGYGEKKKMSAGGST